MVAIGDIVEVRQFPGQRWAAIGPHVHGVPPGRLWRVRRDGAEVGRGRPPQGRTIGDGDLRVLSHPQFTPGQIVTHHGREAEVLRDDGDTVRLRYQQLRPPALDRLISRTWRERTIQICETDIERGDLVAQNL